MLFRQWSLPKLAERDVYMINGVTIVVHTFQRLVGGLAMPCQYLLYEKQREGVLITLDRPEQLNAFNDGLRQELEDAFDEA